MKTLELKTESRKVLRIILKECAGIRVGRFHYGFNSVKLIFSNIEIDINMITKIINMIDIEKIFTLPINSINTIHQQYSL